MENREFFKHIPHEKIPLNLASEFSISYRATDGKNLSLHNHVDRFWSRVYATKARYPSAQGMLLGLTAVALGYGLWNQSYCVYNKYKVDVMKKRMQKPLLEVEGNHNLLFNESGKANCLYRVVKIKGRPIHAKGMMVPITSYGLPGYEYILPLVTKENEDGSHQEGVLLNLGFMPAEYKEISNRPRIENVEEQEFVCVVNDAQHLSNRRGGNHPERNQWVKANLKQMAEFAGFKNLDQSKQILLEHVNPSTVLDEKNCQHLDINSNYQERFPYRFTRSGILQQEDMYWNYQRKASYWTDAATVSAIAWFVLFLAK